MTSLGKVPEVSVLNTINPVATLLPMGVFEIMEVRATRGINKPLSEKLISNPAEVFGVKDVVPMPTFCENNDVFRKTIIVVVLNTIFSGFILMDGLIIL